MSDSDLADAANARSRLRGHRARRRRRHPDAVAAAEGAAPDGRPPAALARAGRRRRRPIPNSWSPCSDTAASRSARYLDSVTDLPPVRQAIQDGAARHRPRSGVRAGRGRRSRRHRARHLRRRPAAHRRRRWRRWPPSMQRAGNAVTVLTASVPDPTGYGRIVRDSSGALAAIVEQTDADDGATGDPEINSGVYAFDGGVLTDALDRLSSANAQGERYLTDVVGDGPARRAPGRHLVTRRPGRDRGRQRPGTAGRADPSAQRPPRPPAQLAGVTVTIRPPPGSTPT